MAQRGTTAEIDLAELERLAAMQATDEEIAAWFGVTSRTIERRRREPKFSEAMQRGKAKGRLTVRRAQLKMLEQGNATMAIWLGKQYLGQTEVRPEMYANFNAFVGVAMPAGAAEPSTGIAASAAIGRKLMERDKLGKAEQAVETRSAAYEMALKGG